MTAEEIATLILKETNYMGKPEDIAVTIVRKLVKEHRTIQQSFFRMVRIIIDGYVKYHNENPTAYDDRNREAVSWAHEVASIQNHSMPMI